jgi:hypothetical protein
MTFAYNYQNHITVDNNVMKFFDILQLKLVYSITKLTGKYICQSNPQ